MSVILPMLLSSGRIVGREFIRGGQLLDAGSVAEMIVALRLSASVDHWSGVLISKQFSSIRI